MKIIRKRKGVGIVEIMVAVLIVAVLGVVSFNSYIENRVKADVARGIIQMSENIPVITELYVNNGKLPEHSDVVSALDGAQVANVSIHRGVISYRFESPKELRNQSLFLIPTELQSGSLLWRCAASIHEKYLPQNCESMLDELESILITDTNTNKTYTLKSRLRWFNAYKGVYDSGYRITPENVFDENGRVATKGADALFQALANAFLLHNTYQNLINAGYNPDMLPYIEKIKLHGDDTHEIARQLMVDAYGDLYDGVVLWEE